MDRTQIPAPFSPEGASPPTSVHRDMAARAVAAAGWPGIVLPYVTMLGCGVWPVIQPREPQWAQRLAGGQRPESDLSTLALWEGLPELKPPPSPLRIVGWVAAGPRFIPALTTVTQLVGFGAGLVLLQSSRPPRSTHLLQADLADTTVVWHRPAQDTLEVLVPGIPEPDPARRNSAAIRYREELLFAVALACNLPDPAPDFPALPGEQEVLPDLNRVAGWRPPRENGT